MHWDWVIKIVNVTLLCTGRIAFWGSEAETEFSIRFGAQFMDWLWGPAGRSLGKLGQIFMDLRGDGVDVGQLNVGKLFNEVYASTIY